MIHCSIPKSTILTMYPVSSHLTISALHHPPLAFPLYKAIVSPSLGLMTEGISLHLSKEVKKLYLSMPFTLFSPSRWMKTLSQVSTEASLQLTTVPGRR